LQAAILDPEKCFNYLSDKLDYLAPDYSVHLKSKQVSDLASYVYDRGQSPPTQLISFSLHHPESSLLQHFPFFIAGSNHGHFGYLYLYGDMEAYLKSPYFLRPFAKFGTSPASLPGNGKFAVSRKFGRNMTGGQFTGSKYGLERVLTTKDTRISLSHF